MLRAVKAHGDDGTSISPGGDHDDEAVIPVPDMRTIENFWPSGHKSKRPARGLPFQQAHQSNPGRPPLARAGGGLVDLTKVKHDTAIFANN